MLRLWLLFFGAGVGGELLLYGGMATLAFGIIGVLASQELGRPPATACWCPRERC